MQAALRAYASAIDSEVKRLSVDIQDRETREDFQDALRGQMVLETEFTPYKFHVSEDIYTSIVLHNDPDRRWKSVMHPRITVIGFGRATARFWARLDPRSGDRAVGIGARLAGRSGARRTRPLLPRPGHAPRCGA